MVLLKQMTLLVNSEKTTTVRVMFDEMGSYINLIHQYRKYNLPGIKKIAMIDLFQDLYVVLIMCICMFLCNYFSC